MSVYERFTARSGVRIRYLDNAPTDPVGLPILFSPGFTDYADEYTEVLDAFGPCRALVVEVRGRGGSDTPDTGYTAVDHMADLRAVLDEEGIDRFHMMTFSRGTTWGLDLVLAQPERVATVSIGDYWAREKHVPAEASEHVMTTRFRGVPMTERVQPHVISELFGESIERDLYEPLATGGMPVLVATGTEPGCMLAAPDLQEFRDRIPGVEIAVIPGAAHDLFRQDRLAYQRAVSDFIARRAPGT
jgi:pimeloyl-ACP methyl ester carboxylesterase